MGLVPVKNELTYLPIANHVLTHLIVLPVRSSEARIARRLESPTCARKAVLRGVNRLSGTLCGKVPDEEPDRSYVVVWVRCLVDPIQELTLS